MNKLNQLLQIPGRVIFQVPTDDNQPAVFFLVDNDVGGVLINTPSYSPELFEAIHQVSPIKFIFLPTKFGGTDLAEWKKACDAEIIAHELEANAISAAVDIKVGPKSKLTRTIEFLPMGGRTAGACALYIKNKPGVVFFGEILNEGENGWPTVITKENDFSSESRLIGALALKDLKFQYAFTDSFKSSTSQFGPDADKAITANIERLF